MVSKRGFVFSFFISPIIIKRYSYVERGIKRVLRKIRDVSGCFKGVR